MYKKWVSEADEAIKLLGPFRLRDGRVVIRPVKWTVVSKD